MRAMIFAAGLGTRLKPITDNKPKALVEVNGVPMLEHIIKKLISFSFNEIIINVHYLADQIIDFLKSKNNFNIHIEISDEKDLILDTGGALKKASHFLNDNKPFLLHNVDILHNLDLKAMSNFHLQSGALATLSVQERDSSRVLLFSEDKSLCSWKNKKNGEIKKSNDKRPVYEFAFNGIHVINPKIFDLISEDSVFSIIDLYLRLAKFNTINFYHSPEAQFLDIGSIEHLKLAEDFLRD